MIGSRYRLETFFFEEESHTQAPRWASNLGEWWQKKNKLQRTSGHCTHIMNKYKIKAQISQKMTLTDNFLLSN